MMANFFFGPDILVLFGVLGSMVMPIAMFVTMVWLIRKCTRELADAIRQRPAPSGNPTAATPPAHPHTQ
jgi:hypothetical protein